MNTKKKLKNTNIEKVIGWNADPIGFLFTYEGQLFRAINNQNSADVLALFDLGVVDELNRKGMIPFTTISEYELDRYNVILKHEKIEPITFSTEWSFEMLKDVALRIVSVNKILFKFIFKCEVL